MRPELSTEELVTFRRKLLYARWLYQKGTVDSQSHDELSHLTAMMHFHNAIEVVLHNIALAYGWVPVAQLRTQKFEQILNAVDNKGEGSAVPPRVPQRTQILRLAEMRNSIMHHGQRYNRSEVDEARMTCRLFLRDAVQDFLEEDIDSMSMADLVENQYIADLLRLAEKHKADGDYEKAVGVCAVVFYLAQRALAVGLGAGAIDAKRELDSEMLRSRVNELREFERVFRKVGDLISRVYGNSLFLSSGVDIDLSVRFFDLGFRVGDFTALGDRETRIMVSKPRAKEVAQTDASLAITFAQDVASKMQSMGLGQYMTRIHVWRQPEYIGSREQIEIDLPSELTEADRESAPDTEDVQ